MPLKIGDLCYYVIRGVESIEIITEINLEEGFVSYLSTAWDSIQAAEEAKQAAIKLKLKIKYGQVM